MALQADKQPDMALAALARAVELAEPAGYIRLFLDEGQSVLELVQQLHPDEARLTTYIRRLLAGFDRDRSLKSADDSAQPGATPAEPVDALLSEREREVLQLMIEGHTNQEIAAALVISLNTVKTHAKRIFTQLNVRNRTEATRRARELGLM